MKLNGNLVLNADGSGRIQNAYIEQGTSLPATTEEGRLFYKSDTDELYFGTGTNTWSARVAVATDVSALQTEVDAIETASGGIFATDGTYGAAAVNALTNVTGSTDLLGALTQLDTAISNAAGVDTLGELSNVTDDSAGAGEVMYSTAAGVWAVDAIGASSGVQAHDAGLDSIAGLTTAADTMIYTTAADTYATASLTSFARTLLDDADAPTMRTTLGLTIGTDVQAFDAALSALSNVSGTGFLVQTGVDTFITTSLAASSVAGDEGISVTDASGTGDAPTIGLDITGLTAEAGTASGTDELVMFDGTNNVKLTLTQLNTALTTLGTAFNDLSDVTAPTSGLTIGDAYVLKASAADAYTLETLELADINNVATANGSVTADDINVLVGDGTGFDTQVLTAGTDLTADTTGSTVVLNVDDSFLRNTGDTLDSGTLTIASGASINAATGSTISMVDAPSASTHVTNKAYVDALVAGLTWKNSAVAGTTGNVTLSGGAPNTVDGVTLAANDRVLVLNQTSAAENGIYEVTTLGTGSDGTWTRVTDMDSLTPIDEVNAAAVWVEQGTTYGDTGWTVTSQVATLGTDAITWTQFTGASGITAGTGLELVGNTLNVNMGAGIIQLPTDEVGIDLYATNNPLLLTVDGSTSSTVTGAQLHVRYDNSTIGVNGSTQLYVPAQGITATELASTVAGDGIAGGNGTALSFAPVELVDTATTASDFLVLSDADASGAPIKRLVSSFITDHSLQTTITASDGVIVESNDVQLNIGALTDTAVVGADTIVFNDGDTAGAAGTHAKRSFANVMADLDIVNGITANGFTVRTAADTYTSRSIAVSGAGAEAGLAVTNGDGVSGNPTLGLDILNTAALGATPDTADSLVMYDASGTANVRVTVAELADAVSGATTLNELSDVNAATYTQGDVIVADGTDSYDQTTVQYTYEATGVAQTSYTIGHGLGQFVSVTVLDAGTNEVIIPNTITMNSTGGGETVITLSSALLIKAVIVGFNPTVTTQNFT